jgi:hypothetical protein
MINRSGRRMAAALAVGLALSSPGMANPSEDDFATFLHRKYSKTGGLFGALDKFLPASTDASSPVPVEGHKPDGSYWWGAYFGPGNVGVFGWAHRALSERCLKDGGELMPILQYPVLGGASRPFVWLENPGGAGGFVVTTQMLRDWSHGLSDGRLNAQVERRYSENSRNAASVDARQVLGVFTCRAGGKPPLWHVSILPTPVGQWGQFVSNQSTGTSWVMLRIQAVTRTLIDQTNATYAARTESQQRTDTQSQTIAAKRNAERIAGERVERSSIAAFQKAIAVGDDTNCGLILGFKGELVEVQVPVDIELPSRASRIFIKRAALAPPKSQHDCYEHGVLTGLWYVGRTIDTSAVP